MAASIQTCIRRNEKGDIIHRGMGLLTMVSRGEREYCHLCGCGSLSTEGMKYWCWRMSFTSVPWVYRFSSGKLSWTGIPWIKYTCDLWPVRMNLCIWNVDPFEWTFALKYRKTSGPEVPERAIGPPKATWHGVNKTPLLTTIQFYKIPLEANFSIP